MIDRGLLLAESSLSLVIVLIMVLVAVLQAAVGLFGAQPAWLGSAEDIVMQGTIWAAFLGASFATRGRRHLAIDALGRILPDRARRVVVAVAATLGSVVAFSLARGIYEALLDQAHTTQEQIRQFAESGIAGAEVDRSYQFHFIIPGGFLLIGARLLLHAFHEWLATIRAGTSRPEGVAQGGHDAPRESAVRCAPVSQATGLEIGIAIASLLGLLAIARGTTVLGPLAVVVAAAAMMLAVPLVLRWRARRSLDPTVPVSDGAAPTATVGQIVGSLAGVAVVIGAAWYGIQNIQSIPLAWGVAFFVGMALLGAPLFSFLGGLALFLWLHGTADTPAMSLPNAVEDVLGPHFARMSVLPTIPVFTLAGYLMSESRTPERLVRVARAFLGFAPGGLGIVCVLASAFFTIFSGASGITIVAIGGLLLPALLKDRYPEKFSLGLVTTGGALGITFFPCLPLIVYGIVAGLQEVPPGVERLELEKFFLSGIGPGLLVITLMVAYSLIIGVRSKVPRSKFDAREAGAALWEAKWELLLPVFLLGGLKYGIFGPAQAAAFTAFYVLLIEVFIYKDLSLTKDLPRIIPESMVLVGAIFVKLCAATVLTFYFVQAQTADHLFEWLTCGPPAEQYLAAHSETIGTCREAVDALARVGKSAGGLIDSPISFLIALNVFLLVVGMLMDIFSAIVVIVPLIMGIALHFNINPYHLGIIFLMNLEIGYLMPPMGLNLFIAGFRFERPVPDLYRVVLPFIALFVVALMVTTYVPELTLGFGGGGHRGRHEAVTRPERPGGRDVQPEKAGPRAEPADGGGTTPPAGQDDCDAQRDDESFDEFDRRCNITGAYPRIVDGGTRAPSPAPAVAPGSPDCDEPRPDESFEAFDRRCHVTDGAR
ncbi:MAG: TRAP transporter large permease subunit [Deltaproteobacteria bacterium]|nr:TRAP transporter large permease subunit [Deltaproteobacteria bacterium]